MNFRDEKLHKLIAEQAAEWHVACSEGDLSPQQARDFMRWLRTSSVHISEYLTVARIANDVREAARSNREPLQDLLTREGKPVQLVTTRLGLAACPDEPLSLREYCRTCVPYTSRPRDARIRPVTKWVAAIAVLAVAFIVVWAGLRAFAREPTQEVFTTRHGELRSLRLPDDTFVQLDSDSAIKVRFDHSSRTVVVDRGQAYFKVTKDSGRPFRVRVGRSLVRDIGTAFDVYRRSSYTAVTVSSGHVQVWSVPEHRARRNFWQSWFGFHAQPSGKPVASLGAGQQVALTDAGQVARLGTVDLPSTLAWTRGRIAFDHQSVASVAAEFSRYNTVQIDVVNPRIGALPITGVFNAHDVSAFVAFLRGFPNVSVEKRGRTIVIAAAKR